MNAFFNDEPPFEDLFALPKVDLSFILKRPPKQIVAPPIPQTPEPLQKAEAEAKKQEAPEGGGDAEPSEETVFDDAPDHVAHNLHFMRRFATAADQSLQLEALKHMHAAATDHTEREIYEKQIADLPTQIAKQFQEAHQIRREIQSGKFKASAWTTPEFDAENEAASLSHQFLRAALNPNDPKHTATVQASLQKRIADFRTNTASVNKSAATTAPDYAAALTPLGHTMKHLPSKAKPGALSLEIDGKRLSETDDVAMLTAIKDELTKLRSKSAAAGTPKHTRITHDINNLTARIRKLNAKAGVGAGAGVGPASAPATPPSKRTTAQPSPASTAVGAGAGAGAGSGP